jgi:4-hydroxy-tetrahydrodipicolinate reductase
MRVALFGAGKTGSKVLERASGNAEVLGPYTSRNPADPTALRSADAVVLFVPGGALPGLLPLLLEAGKPVVSGATGFAFPEEAKQKLKERGIPWVQGSNFSLGMNLAFELARRMGEYLPAVEQGEFHIREVHHTKKLDAPSGTALSLERALGRKVEIESIREGDVIGEHRLELRLPGERVVLDHSALDRGVFAEGALWAARFLCEKKIAAGFHLFEDLVKEHFFSRNTERKTS